MNEESHLKTGIRGNSEVLRAIRALCQDLLPGYEEGMQYAMPTDGRDGGSKFAFPSQKHVTSLCGMKQDALEPLRAQFRGAGIGKGCNRHKKPEAVDLHALA